MALHEILTQKRIELGLSLDEIVKRSGVPKGTVAKIMSGNTPNPQIESLKAIAYALDLTLDDLDENPARVQDSDLWELREALRRRPEMRTLFSLTKNATASEIRQAISVIEALKNANAQEESE